MVVLTLQQNDLSQNDKSNGIKVTVSFDFTTKWSFSEYGAIFYHNPSSFDFTTKWSFSESETFNGALQQGFDFTTKWSFSE